MGSRVTIKSKGKFGFKQSQIIELLSNKHIEAIAKDTETIIKEKIIESLQRPGSTGNLANSFFAERIGIRGWGVGNIPFLNKNASYWRWINYGVAGTGRTTPPPSIGSFSPGNPAPSGGDFRKGRFAQNSGSSGGFLMNPNKPIEPHNYIARTLVQVPGIIKSVLIRIKR